MGQCLLQSNCVFSLFKSATLYIKNGLFQFLTPDAIETTCNKLSFFLLYINKKNVFHLKPRPNEDGSSSSRSHVA